MQTTWIKPFQHIVQISFTLRLKILKEVKYLTFTEQSFDFFYKADLKRFDNIDEDCIYFCGHSLGLQPVETKKEINKTLDQWGNL